MQVLARMAQGFCLVPVAEGNAMVRLSKWISEKGVCSRREAEEFIRLGLVRVDGKRVFDNALVPAQAGLKAFTALGVQKAKPVTRLWMMNKPRGCICTHRDPQRRPTVYSLFPKQFEQYGHLMSVGRLDFNSEGLLLVTNDNTLKGLLQNPAARLERRYRVKVHGRMTPQKMEKMNSPVTIKGQEYGPLKASVDRHLATNSWIDVALTTGKNREIRRIMQKCDLEVNKLIRVAYGPYKLGALKHRDIAEIPISQGLERKLKTTKAKELRAKMGGQQSNCLIEVDIRDKAIGLARTELQARQLQQQQKKQEIGQTKQLQAQSTRESQTESSQDDNL